MSRRYRRDCRHCDRSGEESDCCCRCIRRTQTRVLAHDSYTSSVQKKLFFFTLDFLLYITIRVFSLLCGILIQEGSGVFETRSLQENSRLPIFAGMRTPIYSVVLSDNGQQKCCKNSFHASYYRSGRHIVQRTRFWLVFRSTRLVYLQANVSLPLSGLPVHTSRGGFEGQGEVVDANTQRDVMQFSGGLSNHMHTPPQSSSPV